MATCVPVGLVENRGARTWPLPSDRPACATARAQQPRLAGMSPGLVWSLVDSPRSCDTSSSNTRRRASSPRPPRLLPRTCAASSVLGRAQVGRRPSQLRLRSQERRGRTTVDLEAPAYCMCVSRCTRSPPRRCGSGVIRTRGRECYDRDAEKLWGVSGHIAMR